MCDESVEPTELDVLKNISLETTEDKVRYINQHLREDMKWLAFAAVQYQKGKKAEVDGKPDCFSFLQIPLQDSALVRSRAVLDFLRAKSDKNRNYYLRQFIPESAKWSLPVDEVLDEWYLFVSGRLLHMGKSRDQNKAFPGNVDWESHENLLVLTNKVIEGLNLTNGILIL